MASQGVDPTRPDSKFLVLVLFVNSGQTLDGLFALFVKTRMTFVNVSSSASLHLIEVVSWTIPGLTYEFLHKQGTCAVHVCGAAVTGSRAVVSTPRCGIHTQSVASPLNERDAVPERQPGVRGAVKVPVSPHQGSVQSLTLGLRKSVS